MKAIVRETYGSPDVLKHRDIGIPEIGAPNLVAGGCSEVHIQKPAYPYVRSRG
jgi:hypothetical protein